jgi:signal transduction histidine kinase/DNA-binding response OmpR family regulator
MLLNKVLRIMLLAGLVFFANNRLYADDHVHQISSRNFNALHEIGLIDSVWSFHPDGSNSDHNTILKHSAFGELNAPKGWRGSGWFGIWIKASPELVNRKLSLRINHDGASEIFVDGKPVGGYGKVGNSAQNMEAVIPLRELIPLWFTDSKPHLITIHYSNFFGVYPDFLGFQVSIGDYELRAKQLTESKQLYGFVPIFAAAEIILGLLHLLLFLFYPKQKLNLYYAIFVLLVGINGISVYLYYCSPFPSVQYLADLLTYLCKVLLMWSTVSLLYRLDYGRIPRLRLITLSAVSLFYIVYCVLNFWTYTGNTDRDYFSIVFLVYTMDSLYSVYHLIRRRQRGVWLILSGIISVILVYFLAWGDVFGLWLYQFNALRIFVMSAGNLILPFCLSLYLALDFARTNQSLALKLQEVEELSALALAREAEKSALIKEEALRLEDIVQQRTAELSEKAEKLRELDSVKSRFFTNIAHEFKTPLTLIINPAKELLAKPESSNSPGYLQLILNNATRLLQLINQLLDLSKLENGLMALTPEPLDLTALIKRHINAWQSTAIPKGITLLYATGPEHLWILADRDKLDNIILNLLSNAIKFTDNGRIEVFLQPVTSTSGKALSLTVRDTGQGIPAAKLPYIFTRFYQADPSDTRSAEGTGVGLAIVKELVELMGGTISAKSMKGLFTEINIQMPYQAAEPIDETAPEIALQTTTAAFNEEEILLTKGDDGKPLILVIEDHKELRDFMHQTLSARYRILSAPDGNAGLIIAQEKVPNLIITDVMMPGLDGYEVSSRLKEDARTSHIPIIILTAKADTDSKVQGIETGADAYLEKPFDQRELFAMIDNLLNTRNQLRELYANSDKWFKETLSMPSIEQDFMTRVRDAVEGHLKEEGYSADQLAIDLGLSRTQLHRKLKALIGQAPGELIRIVRLQYANDLLKRRVATIAEVAYMVGFSSPASFSASFSRHFGFPPSKIAKN